ncbi:WcbI family polysaccharide biosynthesis putative acetyltransferase [Brevundimonas sp.]|uniref:WcbI family polysaccharide biosynthesis putative acetyltransferase n=1 Tax=Brevundimonas sp. TaxID=1871086 RepID=UPI00286C7255|nr:WcbI family polysaccharide biosynthesis putative acetyltransferase [Brevundimonas sp.]
MRRAFVLGNCQAEGISDWMRAAAAEMTVENASIAGVAPGDAGAAAAWSGVIDRSDTVFCQLTDAQLADYNLPSPGDMARVGKIFVRLPVVAFKGFQPDCTYVFVGGHAAAGAMGPYHSAIAVAAFMEGLSVERAIGLFNTFVYAALGYMAEFEAASTVLLEKAREMGLDLSSGVRRDGSVFMHTINHPSITILGEVAIQALARAGITSSANAPAPHDVLGDSFRWPVYPEIAARLGVPGSLAFQGSNAGSEGLMDLRTVLEATFASLEALQAATGSIVLDQDRPMATPVIERAQAFIRRHVVI